MQNTIAFSIALNGYSTLFKKCIESQRRYCKKFDYHYTLIKKTPYPLSNKDSAWLKLYLMREAIKMDFKWVVFIDADCQIREFCPDFRKFMVKSNPAASIFMAQGFSGRINSGVIFLRNSASALIFLDKILNNRYKEVPFEDKALYENGHVIHFGKNNPDVEIIPNRLWNNNYELDEKSYIQHYSGGILRENYIKNNFVRASFYKILKGLKIFKSNNVKWENKKSEILKEIVIQNFA